MRTNVRTIEYCIYTKTIFAYKNNRRVYVFKYAHINNNIFYIHTHTEVK